MRKSEHDTRAKSRRYHRSVARHRRATVESDALSPVLDERGRRRFAAAEALTAGRGGLRGDGDRAQHHPPPIAIIIDRSIYNG
jgi:hypothetical protein